jgi:hypothetical protein
MGAAALLGSLDPTHHAEVYGGERGLRLVLHHGSDCRPHQHGAVAKVLTFFAQATTPTEPDHIVQFGSGESLRRQAPITVPSFDHVEHPMLALSEIPPWSPREQPNLPSWHPPPDESRHIVCLRSILLLI